MPGKVVLTMSRFFTCLCGKASGLVFKAFYNHLLKHIKQRGRASLFVGSFLLLFQEHGTGRDLLQLCLVPAIANTII